MVKSWEECKAKGQAIRSEPSREKAKSLLETAKGRIEFFDTIDIDEKNVNYIFEGYYSSVNEMIHALTAMKGLVIKNHSCLGLFMEHLGRKDIFNLFDDCRWKRNRLQYYGRRMNHGEAKKAIKKTLRIIKKLDSIISS